MKKFVLVLALLGLAGATAAQDTPTRPAPARPRFFDTGRSVAPAPTRGRDVGPPRPGPGGYRPGWGAVPTPCSTWAGC